MNRAGMRWIAALGTLYALTAVALCGALPGPHTEFDYMVIGSGSIGVAMLAFYAGRVVLPRFRRP
jgi:hypothetical protein